MTTKNDIVQCSTVASGGTYGSQADRSTITETFNLAAGCYDFPITDTYGDGICCSYGNGSYSITSNGSTLVSGATLECLFVFTSSETKNFCVGGTTTVMGTSVPVIENKLLQPSVSVYPNPARESLFIDITGFTSKAAISISSTEKL